MIYQIVVIVILKSIIYMVIEQIYKDAIVYSNLLALASIGLTLTYTVTKVPNFAHASFLTIGCYVTLTIVSLFKLNVYLSIPISFLIGSIIGAIVYIFVIKQLMKRGADIVRIMIATLAIDIIIFGAINIYADVLDKIGIFSRNFILRDFDIKFNNIEGVLIISSLLIISLAIFLYLFLYKSKYGIAIRAAIENPSLAKVMGVNVENVYLFSWFFSAGLASMAGSLFPLWFAAFPDTGVTLLPPIFASSILGGFTSIFGTMIGAYIIGMGESLLVYYLSLIVGYWILAYKQMFSILMIFITLLLFPKGISGIIFERVIRKWSR